MLERVGRINWWLAGLLLLALLVASCTETEPTVRVSPAPPGPTSGYFSDLQQSVDEHSAAQDAIFEETARALGLEDSLDPSAWVEVLAEAAPRAIDEAFSGLLAAIRSLTPPSELSDLHDRYVAAVEALVSNRTEFIAALEAAIESGEVDGELPYLEDLESACSALQDAAAADGVLVDLGCE